MGHHTGKSDHCLNWGVGYLSCHYLLRPEIPGGKGESNVTRKTQETVTKEEQALGEGERCDRTVLARNLFLARNAISELPRSC